MTPRPLKLGFAGVGWIGRHRMQALLDAGLADAVALLDPDTGCLDDARGIAPDATVCASFDELCARDIDGVVIATPSAAHAMQCIDALERGLPVFCQKPLGRHGDEAAAAVEAARRNDRRLGVDLSYRHLAGMDHVHELLRRGDLGHVYAMQLTFHNAYGPGKPWFYERRLSGGGCVIDLGIHLVDLALWLLGAPRVLDVRGDCFSQGRPLRDLPDAVEDYATARLRLDGGTVVDLACSWNLPVGQDAEIGMRIYGTGGGIGLRNVDGSFFDFVLERFDGRQRTTLASPPDAWGGRAIVDWASNVRRSPAYDDGVQTVVDVARIMDAIYAP